MKLKLNRGTTSKLLRIFIQNSTSSSISGLTGLVYNSSGLTWYYIREGDATATQVTPLATMTVGTWATGGFKEVDSTNMPGIYEIGIPNAALSSGNSVVMMLKGATNMSPVIIEVELDAVNYQSATNLGLSCLPTANPAASGGLPTVGTGAGQISPDGAGNVKLAASQTFSTTGSVGSVTGSVGSVTGAVGSISGVTFPTNFSILAIAASTGQVGVDLTNIKQATSPTTLNNITIPTVTNVGSVTGNVGGNVVGSTASVTGSVGSVTGLTTSTIAAAILATPAQKLQTDASGNALISGTQAVPLTGNTGNTVFDCLNAARAQGFGKWALSGTTLTLYGSDGTTVVRTFTLDSATAPTQRS